MSSYEPLPSDGVNATWEDDDAAPVEVVTARWDNEAWTVSGTLPSQRAEYVLRLSPFWQPRQFLLFRDMDEPDLWLGTDGSGRWGEINGAHRPDLDGVTGIYVDDAPFALASTIRRLSVDVGDRIEVPLAHVDTETLAVTPTRWWFHRGDDHHWIVERVADEVQDDGGDGHEPRVPPTRFEFDVDDHGIVGDIAGLARRRS